MKEIFIERSHSTIRIAIKENNLLKECFIEEESSSPLPDEIYKGIVKNIVPGIKSAFIDIGCEKNAYLYMDKKFNNTNIKKGDSIVIQVSKEELGDKGAKVTNIISLPGTYVVIHNLNKKFQISSKITDENLREYLLKNLENKYDIGITLRSICSYENINELNEELNDLYNKYIKIINTAEYTLKPGIIYNNGGILAKILRDKLDFIDENKIYVDNIEDYNSILEYINSKGFTNTSVLHHTDKKSLFESYSIEKNILMLRKDKVYLKCGGYINLNKTEAMNVIDVNSGKNVKNTSIEKTSFITNLQAAEEAARQIRLRNLGGIIVIDFIDMKNEEYKSKVLEKLKEGFRGDKSRPVVYPFTELSLVQISRKRYGKSIVDFIEETCSHCKGTGKKLKFSYFKLLLRNEIKNTSGDNIENIYIKINSIYKEEIERDIFKFVEELECLKKKIYINFSDIEEFFTVEPLLFHSQVENLKKYLIYE